MTTPPSGASPNASAPTPSTPSSASLPPDAAGPAPTDPEVVSEGFEEWARRASRLAAARRGRREVPSLIPDLARLHDELAAVRTNPAPTASSDELAVLDEAITALHTHLDRLVAALDRTPEHEFPRLNQVRLDWAGDRWSPRDLVEEWAADGPAHFAQLPLSARAEALDGVTLRGTIQVPEFGVSGSRRTPRWRVAVDPASAGALLEAQAELDRRGTRTKRIHDEIGQWLPLVANHPSVLAQYGEGALHRRDAIAELERWLWTHDGRRWTTHTTYHLERGQRRLLDKTPECTRTETIAPEAYRVLEELREHLARWPQALSGVPAAAAIQPGFAERTEFCSGHSPSSTLTIYSVEVQGTVGELGFKWLVDLRPPQALLVERPRERPEVVLVQRDGATARVVTNIPRLLVRVVDPDGPEGTEETWVTLPGEAHPVYLGRFEPEHDPEFVDRIRAHAPRRPPAR